MWSLLGALLLGSEPTQSVALSHVSHVLSSQAQPFVPAVESATTSQLRTGASSTQVMPPPSSTLMTVVRTCSYHGTWDGKI